MENIARGGDTGGGSAWGRDWLLLGCEVKLYIYRYGTQYSAPHHARMRGVVYY